MYLHKATYSPHLYDSFPLEIQDIEINVGEEENIQTQSITDLFNEPITYIAEDEEIVQVDEAGNIKGLKEGTANINVFINSKGINYETVQVKVNKDNVKETLTSSDLVYGDYRYRIYDNEVTITGYTGKSTSISVPSSIDGMLVTEIGIGAFMGGKSLKEINLPESIKEINSLAFHGLELESFKLPSNIERIGGGIINSQHITKMFIPKTVKHMQEAFSRLENLEEVEFENGINEIPSFALISCKNMKKVIIPESVTVIDYEAFKKCESLTEINLPEGIEKIGTSAFYGIELESFKLPPNIEMIGSNIINSSHITKMFIPKTVTSMSRSFSSLENLEEVEFEKGINKIPNYALADCKSIKKVIIPASVTYISSLAFKNTNDFTIYGYKGSYAELYAYNNNINFIDIGIDYLLNALDIKDKLNQINFNGGKVQGPSINVFGEKIPLFDVDAKAKIPFDSIQVKPNYDTKTVQVLIGFEGMGGDINLDPNQSNKKWNESYNQVRSLYKSARLNFNSAKFSNDFSKLRKKLKKTNSTLLVNGKGCIAGYMEFSYQSEGVRFLEGGIITEIGVDASKTHRWLPPWSAVYTTMGFKTGANGKIYLQPNDNSFKLNTNLGANFNINAGIGAGSKKYVETYVEGILTGILNGNVKLPASTVQQALSINCSAAAKLAIVAFGYDLSGGKLEYNFPTYNIYPRKSREYLFEINPSDIDLKKAKPISRDYINKQSNIETYNLGSDFIKENLYTYNSPNLVNLGNNKKLLVWVDDNGKKSDVNRTSLMYSVFSQGNWSTPKEIAETGTYNDVADIYVKDGKAHILWRKSNTVLGDNATVTDLAKSLDLYYTVFDGNEMGETIQVTKGNEICEISYAIAVEGDKVAITWIENSVNDILLQNGSYKLYAKEYINGQEQEKVLITSSNDEISSTDIDYINNKYTITYNVVDNSSEDTVSDIYLYNNNNLSKIERDNNNNYLPEFIDGNLYFLNDDNLKIYNTSTNNIEETGLDEINNFSIVSNGNSKAIVTMIPSDDSFELLASYYNDESKSWGPWKQVTKNEQFIRTYSVVMNDDSTICAALSLAELTGDNSSSVFGKSSLIVSGLKEISDLAINGGIYYDYDKVVPNGELDLNFEVTNNSSEDLETLNISILNENNEVIEQSNIECEILSNETKEISYTYRLPNNIRFTKIKVFVKPTYDEIKLDNNVIETSIGYGDISLDNVEINEKDNQYILTCEVSNKGYTNCENIKLSIYDTSVNGDILDTINVGTLEVGNSKEVSYTIPKEFISNNNDKEEIALYLNVESTTEESTLINNEYRLLFNLASSTPTLLTPIIQVSSISDSSNEVTWNEVPQASGYEIYRSTNSNGEYLLLEKITSGNLVNYTDTALTAGEIYYYKVRAYKEIDGETIYSDYSEIVSSTPMLPVESVNLNKTSLTLLKGKSEKLIATISPSNATNKNLVWKSSNIEVATVDTSGNITAIGEGIATITVATKDGNKISTCEVTVTNKVVSVKSVKLNEKSLSLVAGEEKSLIAEINPENASNKELIWSSSNEEIATVDENGKVTGVSSGTATITVRTKDKGKKATCKVSVKVPVESITIKDELQLPEEMVIGQNITLKATINPSNATNKTILWSTSDKKVATVDSKGKVIAKGSGPVTITARAKDDASIIDEWTTVVVKPITILNEQEKEVTSGVLRLGDNNNNEIQLTAIVKPHEESNQKVEWRSSNKKVATVTEDGKVVAREKGTATITAKSVTNKKSATYKVTVIQPVKSVNFDKEVVYIKPKKSVTLKPIINPSDASDKTVTWESSNIEIATVKNGKVTAGNTPGVTTITIKTKDGNYTAECEVIFTKPVNSVSLNKSNVELDLYTNPRDTLIATLNPSDEFINSNVIWSSSNKRIVSVDEDGNITALKKGTAIITVKTVDGGKTAKCIVIVK